MKSPALRLLGRLFLAAALLYVALGFAVVAVEVRRLAQSAAQASSEVKGLIEQRELWTAMLLEARKAAA